jgi:hypothetical protein
MYGLTMGRTGMKDTTCAITHRIFSSSQQSRSRRLVRDLILFLNTVCIAVFFSICGNAAVSENQTVMQQVQAAFQNRNSNIGEITFLQIIPFYGYETRYLLLAHGIRADKKFSGSLEDELFGLFVLDKSFSKVLSVIDFIRSGRWNDYSVEVRNPGENTILVTCKGATYGDGQIVKKYTTELIYRYLPESGVR